MWNGARLHRAGAPGVDGLVALGTACGAGGDELDEAVAAGLAAVPAGPRIGATAEVTRWVSAAAVCASTALGDRPVPAAVVDLAGSLMVVHARTASEVVAGLVAGHTLAAAWLATRLHAAGLVGVPGAYTATVEAVEGAG